MNKFNEELIQIKSDSIRASEWVQNGIKWLEKNGDETFKRSKIQILDDTIRGLKKVISASEKRPSVAVFGQSQVGKSFLVRTLAQSPINNKLEVLTSNEKIDFIQRINPPGGRESTGIITRFTTRSNKLLDSDYPFKVELLNQLDIAAIIINGYLEDLKEYIDEIDKETILSELLSIPFDDEIHNDISKHDISYFNEYLLVNYKENFKIRELKSIGIFELLFQKLPFMSYDKRYKLLHFLWGKNEFLTRLFNEISETLKSIGFSDHVYLNEQAIINDISLGREFSQTSNVLDVERVKEIFRVKQLPDINVVTNDGEKRTVSRSILCALIKELQFVIPNNFENDNQRKFLLEADLLDFPGSKSREKVPEKVFISNSDTEKLSLFVRGKVSYLFYLYNRDIGISSLLYCMDNEPPLVADSPAFLENWISKFVGNSPKERCEYQSKVVELFQRENIEFKAKRFSPLLIAMTKFNIELTGKGDADIDGEPQTHDSKWHARFKENFSVYMSKPVEDKWTENWEENNDKFNFLFPIRDPNFSTAIFDGYESDSKKEETIRPNKVRKLKDMEVSFMASEVVDQFIIDKEQIWSELTTPNQTGINYLCTYLEPSAHPANLIAQLRSVLKGLLIGALDQLGPEFFSGNLEEDLKVSRIKGAQIFTALLALNSKENRPLVSFMDSLNISETEIWKLLYENRFSLEEDEDEKTEKINFDSLNMFLESIGMNSNGFGNLDELKESLVDFYGVPEKDLDSILESHLGFKLSDLKTKVVKDRKPNFVDSIIEYWGSRITDKSVDAILQRKGVSNSTIESIKLLTGELLKSRSIENVKEMINEILSVHYTNNSTKDQFNLIASCISSILNQYTYSVTWCFESDQIKPVIPKKNSIIFKSESILQDSSIIQSKLDEVLISEYLTQFSIGAKELFSENVRRYYGLEENFNMSANQEIEEIIKEIKVLV